ncbi:zinc-binding dehydrogenase [Mycolicibacterium vaccae]|uniref:Putative NAD-dependent alcohol dehydrogenase n=2 Tax=Mycolicibacterium vaccae TaxID=1810 RepID=K0UVS0_MYCVA|nr:alcohol dehydrogenase [Mycolicibacterium vaccae 95051]EJZ09145.1 putative NAD-dependent alcohol dehydrogenase [Mycolicibacterium vaccae ATCC 25954]MCV7061630.1 zinc-binding dehydrogenase [Mycolicibacterium vaccae]
MRAVTFHEFGGPDVLRVDEIPTPRPGPGEVLLRVAAVSVGRLLDVVARSGRHPYAKYTFPHVLGAEHVGVVAAVGDTVTGVAPGDRVATFPLVTDPACPFVAAGHPELSPTGRIIGTHLPGAYCDYIAVPATNVSAVPDDISPADAVALALAGAVAMNQFTRAGLEPGHRVIVQGASSALGSTTALLARHLGARVIVTSRSEHKRARLRALGFDTVLEGASPTFAADARAAFDGHGADLVIDNLGDPRVWANGMDALAIGGAMVSSGAFIGRTVPVDLQRLYTLGQRVIGVRTGNLAAADRVWKEAAAGFRSVVDRTFAMSEASRAHEYVESDAGVGRVALLTEPPS